MRYNSDMLLFLISCHSALMDTSEPEPISFPEAVWSVKDMREKLNHTLMGGFPDAISLRNIYADLLQNRDSSCPNFINSSSWTGTWEANCQTSSGSSYSGTGTLVEFFGTELPYDMSLHASFELKAHDGAAWAGGGLSSFVHSLHNGEETWIHDIGGSHQYQPTDTLPSEKRWMEQFAASVKTEMNIRNGEHSLLVTGGLQLLDGLEDSSFTTLHFDHLDWRPEYCQSPEGSLKVRDPSGYWYDIQLKCQKRCGTIVWFSEEVGRYCSVPELLKSMEVWQERWDTLLEGP